MKIANILLTLLFLLGLTNCVRINSQIPKDFIETNLGEIKRDRSYSQNKSGVKINNGKLEVEKVQDSNKCEFPVSNGKLVVTDKGEWGGQLSFIPTDITKRTLEIKEGNIKFIFSFKNKLYFIEGLVHGNFNEGELYEIHRFSNRFVFKKIFHFDDAPEAFKIYQDKLLIATHGKFYSIENLRRVLIYKNIYWNGLYPNSIAVIDDKNVFIGLNGGIAKLDLTKRNLKFYKRRE